MLNCTHVPSATGTPALSTTLTVAVKVCARFGSASGMARLSVSAGPPTAKPTSVRAMPVPVTLAVYAPEPSGWLAGAVITISIWHLSRVMSSPPSHLMVDVWLPDGSAAPPTPRTSAAAFRGIGAGLPLTSRALIGITILSRSSLSVADEWTRGSSAPTASSAAEPEMTNSKVSAKVAPSVPTTLARTLASPGVDGALKVRSISAVLPGLALTASNSGPLAAESVQLTALVQPKPVNVPPPTTVTVIDETALSCEGRPFALRSARRTPDRLEPIAIGPLCVTPLPSGVRASETESSCAIESTLNMALPKALVRRRACVLDGRPSPLPSRVGPRSFGAAPTST